MIFFYRVLQQRINTSLLYLFCCRYIMKSTQLNKVLTMCIIARRYSMPTVYPKKYAHGFCFVVVIHWLIFPYPSGLLHWHCGNLTIAPVPAKQPWWIWMNTSCEFIMNDYITTPKQSTTKPCAYFLGYTVYQHRSPHVLLSDIHVVLQGAKCNKGCKLTIDDQR